MKLRVSDALWERLQPLLPPPRRFRFPGRKPLDYRKILTGILFVAAIRSSARSRTLACIASAAILRILQVVFDPIKDIFFV